MIRLVQIIHPPCPAATTTGATSTHTHTHIDTDSRSHINPSSWTDSNGERCSEMPQTRHPHTHTHSHTQQGGLSGPSAQEESACWGFSRLVRRVEAQRRRALRLSFSGFHCAQKVKIGEDCRPEIVLPYFLNPFPLFITFSCSPLTSYFFCLTVWCTYSVALTACCSVTSSCTPRLAAWPSPAQHPAARPGRGSTASGTAPRGPACLGRATLSEPNSSSYQPPAPHDRVGDTTIALKSCLGACLSCETNPRLF